MLNCEQFQLLAGADPEHLTWRQRMHRLTCRVCAGYLKDMRAFNRRIRLALDLQHPDFAVTRTGLDPASEPDQRLPR